jgi:hypothetical protein
MKPSQSEMNDPSDSIAILLPHENGKHTGTNWQPYVESHISIAEIEKLTGINFLAPMRTDNLQCFHRFLTTCSATA